MTTILKKFDMERMEYAFPSEMNEICHNFSEEEMIYLIEYIEWLDETESVDPIYNKFEGKYPGFVLFILIEFINSKDKLNYNKNINIAKKRINDDDIISIVKHFQYKIDEGIMVLNERCICDDESYQFIHRNSPN